MLENRKIIYFIIVTLFAIVLILGIVILSSTKSDKLKVYFLNVGQGDAILITSGNNQILIDSGRNGRVTLEKLGKTMPFWDRKLEALIITHSDADHYGGFSDIVDFYKIENVIKIANDTNTSQEWLNLLDKFKAKQINEINSIPETDIVFPSGAKLKIIYPEIETYYNEKDRNENSIVAKLIFGENEFLFTGDLSADGEKKLIAKNIDIQADFLKVAHHGSRSSTSLEFLEKVNPQDVVISVGKNNSYGHPHKEVLDIFRDKMLRIWRTDNEGTIQYECKNISQICQASSF